MTEVALIPACFRFLFTKWRPKRGMTDPCHVHNTFQTDSCSRKDNCYHSTITYTWIKLHKILFGQLTLSCSRAASDKKLVTFERASSQIRSTEERQFAGLSARKANTHFYFQIMASLSIDEDIWSREYTSVYLATVTFVSAVTNVRQVTPIFISSLAQLSMDCSRAASVRKTAG